MGVLICPVARGQKQSVRPQSSVYDIAPSTGEASRALLYDKVSPVLSRHLWSVQGALVRELRKHKPVGIEFDTIKVAYEYATWTIRGVTTDPGDTAAYKCANASFTGKFRVVFTSNGKELVYRCSMPGRLDRKGRFHWCGKFRIGNIARSIATGI